MGLEATTHARLRDAAGAEQAAEVTALLEGDALILRGALRRRIARADIRAAEARDGALVVTHAEGTLTLALGTAAARWAEKLLAPPKPTIDKLDVKPGAIVSVLGALDPALDAALDARAAAVSRGRLRAGSDVVFVAIEQPRDLPRVARAAAALAPHGAIWAVHPRGVPAVQDTVIFAAAKAAGLTYTKVARISDTHTAEKLVIPRDRR